MKLQGKERRGLYRILREKIFNLHSVPVVPLLRNEINDGIIIDVGCGKASPLGHIAKPRRSYWIGVDIFLPYLRESKRKGLHDEYVLADTRLLPFKDDSADYVVALDLIEHLEKSEGFRLLKELERISKRKVILTTPNGFFPQKAYSSNIW